jgi:uncharacterized protein YlxW (UPF0749 family)
MKKNGSQHILFVVFMLLGIVIALQAKNTMAVKKAAANSGFNADKLREQISVVKKETEEYRKAIDENLVMRNDIIREYLETQSDDQLAKEWEMIKLNTGLSGVRGPGIRIKLDDAPARQDDTPVDFLIIHDQDIKVILNDLKKAGAQAIAINGERIVPMSEQVCAGPTIRINGNRHPVPYVIEAIGDPDVLYQSMMESSRIEDMTEFDVLVEISKSKEIVLPKFSSADKLDRYITGLEVSEK